MNDLVKDLMPYLEKLANKLDSSAQALWTLQINQAKVILTTGIMQYTTLISCLIIWGFLCKYFNKKTTYYKQELANRQITQEEFDMKTFGYEGLPIISMILMIIYYIGWVPSITNLMTAYLNPEYWALKELIEMVKAVK